MSSFNDNLDEMTIMCEMDVGDNNGTLISNLHSSNSSSSAHLTESLVNLWLYRLNTDCADPGISH